MGTFLALIFSRLVVWEGLLEEEASKPGPEKTGGHGHEELRLWLAGTCRACTVALGLGDS